MMDSKDERDREEQFVEAWRSWVQRPPLLPSAEAAARVVARLPKRSRSHRWWLLAAAAVVMGLALVVQWTAVTNRFPQTGTGAAAPENPPIGKGEVLIWLDDQTPLYMTFEPPEQKGAQE